jgi:hypothetical protein
VTSGLKFNPDNSVPRARRLESSEIFLFLSFILWRSL